MANGATFGYVGEYEYLHGEVRGVLDPTDPRNRGIANIDQAQRDATGRVKYTASFALMRPVKALASGGKLLVEAPNRGRKYLLTMMNAAKPLSGGSAARALSPSVSNHPVSGTDVGNGFLLREGYTLAWVGWEEVGIPAGFMSARLPVATGVKGEVREEFVLGSRIPADLNRFDLSYPATQATKVRLTVRDNPDDAYREVPSAQWKLSGAQQIVPSTEDGKFESGKLYDAWYSAANPPVLGVGFAIVRDFTSFLRYPDKQLAGIDSLASGDVVPSYRSVTGIGFSQPARFLRDYLELGMNEDSQGRPVFDGLLIYTAGVGKSLANLPFGTPFRSNTRFQDHQSREFRVPLTTDMTGSAVSRIMEINSSSEYRNKAASVLHTDVSGRNDLESNPAARYYSLASLQHNGRPGMSRKKGSCRYVHNTNNPAPVLRALLVAMSEWVEEGTLPPKSRVGKIEDGTLVSPAQVNFPEITGVEYSKFINNSVVYDRALKPAGQLGDAYPVLIPQVDADGNEIAGVRTPDIAVPLATHTGWNFYEAPFPESQPCHMYGALIPFAATEAERVAAGDPRLSLAERYVDRASYVALVREAAQALQANRLLLGEDVVRYVDAARNNPHFTEEIE